MVKVGHRQVVNMIRQGGNNLMVKVVMVTRNPEMEEAMKKKGTMVHSGTHSFWFPKWRKQPFRAFKIEIRRLYS